MAKRRENGEGSIVKKANGSYEARIMVKDPNSGQFKMRTHCRKKRGDVKEWLNQVRVELSTGQYIADSKITLEKWLERWIGLYAKARVRATTWESYESIIKRHISPKLGQIALQKLRRDHIQQLYQDLRSNGRIDGRGGLSTTTVRYLHAILNEALNDAVKDGLLSQNIMRAVTKPKLEKYEVRPLSDAEVKRFLVGAQTSKYYAAFLLECYTGLRRGELLALKWQDIDMKSQTVTVKRGIVRTKEGLVFSDPKTESSRRTIPLPAEVIGELKRHRCEQNKEKLMAGSAYENSDLVFCGAVGRPLDPRSFTKRFQDALKAAGLPQIRFHDMRHTHATLLLTMGQNIKVIQERLGHTTSRMTLDRYSHVLTGIQEQATEALSKALQI